MKLTRGVVFRQRQSDDQSWTGTLVYREGAMLFWAAVAFAVVAWLLPLFFWGATGESPIKLLFVSVPVSLAVPIAWMLTQPTETELWVKPGSMGWGPEVITLAPSIQLRVDERTMRTSDRTTATHYTVRYGDITLKRSIMSRQNANDLARGADILIRKYGLR